MSQRGMTLIELMVGTALLVGGGGALLVGMQYSMIHSSYLNEFQLVMNAVQSRMEELSATPFDALNTGPQYAEARAAAGQSMGLDGDPIPEARLHVRIEPFPPGSTDPTLLTLHVSACWTSRGRVIGEDRNCNGVLDAGEDANNNGWLDSPAMASTRLADND